MKLICNTRTSTFGWILVVGSGVGRPVWVKKETKEESRECASYSHIPSPRFFPFGSSLANKQPLQDQLQVTTQVQNTTEKQTKPNTRFTHVKRRSGPDLSWPFAQLLQPFSLSRRQSLPVPSSTQRRVNSFFKLIANPNTV